MDADDVDDILEWLENVFPDKIQFKSKSARLSCAEGYISSIRYQDRKAKKAKLAD